MSGSILVEQRCEADGQASGRACGSDGPIPAAGRSTLRRRLAGVLRGIGSLGEWCFGLCSLIAGLAFLASIPIVQLVSLGYLLESSGRVARSGRLRDGLVGVRRAARVGGIVVGSWLILLPLRVLADQAENAQLVSAAGPAARQLRLALLVLTALAALHLMWAWFRGGRLRHFLWPAPLRLARTLRGGRWWSEARDGVWHFVAAMRLPHYFSLGTRGFIGAIAWLAIPTMLLIAATRFRQNTGAGALLGLVGGVLLAWVMLYLPFLQAQLAAENRLSAMFRVGQVRRAVGRAPLACWLALLVTLVSALPLYLLKIEATPREVVGLLSLVFVVFILPARLATGWALARAARRSAPRHVLFRWTMRLASLPLVAMYVLVLFFTQYTSWYGGWSLLQQHAVLVPVPFLQ